MAQKPKHIAIIMDGNRREGRQTEGDPFAGHRHGYQNAERIIRAAIKLGVPCLTLYAFSTENWRRSQPEVGELMNLFRRFFSEQADKLVQEGIRVRFIGRRNRVPFELKLSMIALERRTRQNERMELQIAIDYGGQDEIIRAAHKLFWRLLTFRANPLRLNESFQKCLDTTGLPDVDLLIRTGGEARLSNFLLWQSAYAEILFLDVMWPRFSPQDLEYAIGWFAKRERRHGGDTVVLQAAE